ADGRAVRGARRPDARAAPGRAAADLGAGAADDGVHHPLDRGGDRARRPGGRALGPAGRDPRDRADRHPAPAHGRTGRRAPVVPAAARALLAPAESSLLIGLALALVSGLAIGLASSRSWLAYNAVNPWLTALYSTPSVALVPFMSLWLGIGDTAKIAVIALFAVFPILINTQQGVRYVD